MSTGKKEYTLKINGVKQSLTDVTTLETALKNLGKTVDGVNATENKRATVSRQTAKAMSDEEKAAKKLADTKARIEDVNTEANRAQILANKELRERTREVTRQIALEQLQEGSIKALGMQLTNLRNAYDELSEADRQNVTIGGEMLGQIKELDAKYKSLRENTGRFQDSVGNYEKATEGLERLRGGLDSVSDSALGISTNILGGSTVLTQFGGLASEVSERLQKLQLITVLLSQVTAAYNAIVKQNYIQEQARKATDAVRIVQIRAKAAAEAQATKGTVAATAAQKLFNLVAAANPYILLATAIIAVGAALLAFTKKSQDAAKAQEALNDSTRARLDLLDEQRRKDGDNSSRFIKGVEARIDAAKAEGKSLQEIRELEDKIAQERELANLSNKSLYAAELRDIEKNKDALASYESQLRGLQAIKDKEGEDFADLQLSVEIDGKKIEAEGEKAIELLQGAIDNSKRKVTIATEIVNEGEDIVAAQKVTNALRLAEDKRLAKERAAIELAAARSAEDARIKLIRNTFDQQRATLRAQNKREIEDLQRRLKEEQNLTDAARKSINGNIVSLRKQLSIELNAINVQQAAFELEITRQLEKSRTDIITGEVAKRRAEINGAFDDEIEDLRTRLATDKSLTEKSRKEIGEIIINTERKRAQELQKITAEDAQKRADLEISAVENRLQNTLDLIGDLTVRSKNGFQLIDVQATKANLNDANAAYEQYINDLLAYAQTAQDAHEETLRTLEAGTTEYAEEQQRYADVIAGTTRKIAEAQKAQQENAKNNKEIVQQYYRELFDSVAAYASNAANVVTTVIDTISQAIGYQIEELNERLESTNEYYEKAKQRTEDAGKSIEDLEERIRNSSGGTSMALREQLAEQTRARNAAMREEKRLAKEKEKLEADIRKKERQQRKLDLMAQIVMAVASTAQGVTKALGDWMFPLNLVIAGIVGVAGAVQVALMGKQLSKLEKGGEIVGPSHANGGVPLSGKAGQYYEAEGGEFMINKTSYAANKSLVQAINDSPGPISPAAFFGSAGSAPDATERTVSGEDRLVSAIQNIVIRPTVSVTEIEDVRDNLVTVKELAGF